MTPVVNPWSASADLTGITTRIDVIEEAPLNVDRAEFGGDINLAMAAINAAPAGTSLAMYIPSGGNRDCPATPYQVTREELTIFGDGSGTQLRQAANKGTFWNIAASAVKTEIREIQHTVDGVAPDGEPAIVNNSTDTRIYDNFFNNVSSIIRSGQTTPSQRLRVVGNRVTVIDGSRSHWFHLESFSGSHIIRNHVNGSQPTKLCYALVNGAVTMPAGTVTFDNENTLTAFPASGFFWCNGQRFAYTGRTSTTFTGVTGPAGTVLPDNCMIYDGDDSAYVYLDGTVNQGDTLYVDENILFTQPGAESLPFPSGQIGKPFGFRGKATGNSLNNIYVRDNTLDGSHISEFRLEGDSNVDDCRNWLFTRNRMESAAGRDIWIDHATGGSHTMDCIRFLHNFMDWGNGTTETMSPIEVAGGTNVTQFSLKNNLIQWSPGAAQRPGGIFRIAAASWQILGNHGGRFNGTTGINADYVLELLSTPVRCHFDDQQFVGSAGVALIKHFAVVAGNTNRIYGRNNIPGHGVPSIASAATLTLPEGDIPVFTISGNVAITTLTPTYAGHVVILRFTGGAQLTASATMKLVGGTTFTATADDVIMLLCDGTNWRQIAPAAVNA